jgi:hypothetical protein
MACLEVYQPFLFRMEASDLENFQVLFRNSARVIRLHNADTLGTVNPEFGSVSGLCRALNVEQPTQNPDREYSQDKGILHVPRIVPVSDMNVQFQDIDHCRTRILLEDAQRCHLRIKTPGLFQTLAFHASAEVPELDTDCAEVQLKATSINAKVKPLRILALDDGLQLAGLLRLTGTSQHSRCHLLTRFQRRHKSCRSGSERLLMW